MRWYTKKKLQREYLSGVVKQKSKFLWFPVTINKETRWLEKVTIEYKVDYELESWATDNRKYFWKPIRFVND